MKNTLPRLMACLLLLSAQVQAQSTKANLACGEVRYETTIGKSNSYNAADYSSCFNTLPPFDGPDQLFTIEKENDSGRLSISLFNGGKADLDIFLFENKSFENCIGYSIEPNSGNSNIEIIVDGETPLPAGKYQLLVDGYDSNQAADFSISATCGTLNPIYLTKVRCGEKIKGAGNLDYPNDVSAYKIGDVVKGGNTGPERIFYFDLFFQGEVVIQLDNISAFEDFQLFLLSELDEYKGIAHSTNPAGQKEEITTTLEPGRYYIVVEGYQATTGTFDLSVDWDCRENAETAPINIECGETLAGNTVGYRNDLDHSHYAACLGGSLFNGYEYNDALYRFDLENAQAVQIELEILTQYLDLDFFLLESTYVTSDPTTPFPGACIAAATNENNSNKVIFNDLRPGTYWIAIDGGLEGFVTGALPPDEGFFILNLNCFDLPAPCDLSGEFIANGNTIFHSTVDTLSGVFFKGISCIENQYSISEQAQGKVFTYYSNEATNTTISLESQSSAVNLFVFACDGTPRDYSCISGTSTGNRTISFASQAGQYYQLIVLGENSITPFKLSIPTPSGPCSNDIPQVLYPGNEIFETVAGAGNDFDASKSSFFQNCSSGDFPYDGEDRVFQIDIQFESGNELAYSNIGDFGPPISGGDITLEAPTAMGLFLFNYQCGGQNCIAKIELPPEGGTAYLHLADYINKAGTYYLVLDKATNSGSSSFTLTRSQPNIFVVECNDVTENKHIINFAPNVLNGQNFIANNDKIYIDYERRTYNSETLYVPYDVVEIDDNTSSIAPVILLEQDTMDIDNSSDQIATQKCGFKTGENFVFKLLKANGLVLLLDPVFDDSPIFSDSPTTFELEGTTYVKEFRLKNTERPIKVDFEPDNANLNGLSYSNSSFEAHIDVNSPWNIVGLLANDWIKIFHAQMGDENIPLTQGDGPQKVLVQVDANPLNEVRQGIFEIVAENGFARRVILTQLPNPCGAFQFNITEQITDVSCKGQATGSILLTAADGLSFEYQWEDGITGAERTGLAAGSYRVSVSDQGGCATVLDYAVGEPAELTLNIDIQSLEICPGTAATATALPTGGTPVYSIGWSDGTTGATNDNLPPGNYSVTLTDSSNCTETESFQIEAFPVQAVEIFGETSFCAGSSTTLSSTGFQSYRWNTGTTTESIVVNTGGTYQLSVTDENGCEGTAERFVTENPEIELQEEVLQISCFGANDGEIRINANGGTGNIFYHWEPDLGDLSDPDGLAPGIYELTVTDERNCQEFRSLEITEPAPLSLSIDSIRPVSNDTLGFIAVETFGGLAPYTYYWTWPGGFRQTNQPHSGELPTGDYEVKVEDANGCSYTLEVTIVPTRKVFFQDNNLKVYPNPGEGVFYLEWSEPLRNELEVRVTNLIGETINELVIPKAKRKELLNLENQPSGLYLLHLHDQESHIIRKIIVE